MTALAHSTTTGLQLGDGFHLPDEAVTETFAILAKRGKGKTYTAAVLAEELIGAGFPTIVIDPIGVWWGLRSSADGTTDGLPVVIFGGDHGDVPLQDTAGELIADVLIDQRTPAVLDLSLFSKAAARRFMTAFVERLYHRNRDALHVIVDEADAFAPQRTTGDGARLLGAMEDLVRRGRARGIGVTLITQRPAVLNKDVLTQAEVLIALGMTGPRDVAAIDEWVRLHADEDQAQEVKASLPSLPVGTAWIWSPGWLNLLRKVEIRRRTTFDSSATPKPGQRRVVPKRMADIDLAALGERIAATVEQAKADDPAQLRRRIAELERQLKSEQAKPAPDPVVERVNVPALSPEDRGSLLGAIIAIQDIVGRIEAALETVQPPAPATPPPPPEPVSRPAPARHAPEINGHAPAANGALPRAQRAILAALAQHGPRSTTQVAILTGYSHKSGGYRNALSALRTAGLIDGRGEIEITAGGLAALGNYDPLPTGRELLDWWKNTHLGKAERAIVDVLADHYPAAVPTTVIAEQTGYSVTSGGFRNALSRLRSLELAGGRGEVQLSGELMT